jgi:hypothetical protein
MARTRNHRSSHHEPSRLAPPSPSPLSKKDITLEEQTLGGFTLIFQDPNMESKWQSCHLLRQTRLTQRLLFFSALFQGLFYCSDVIDCHQDHPLSHSISSESFFSSSISSPSAEPSLELSEESLSSPSLLSSSPYSCHHSLYLFFLIRLLIALIFLISSFLLTLGLLIPKQRTLCLFQMIYGFPTLAIYYLTRPLNTQWDFLFLVYGLCFFALPKISPLNFIYAFYGVALFTMLFIYTSALRLTSFLSWFLSTVYLLLLVGLFLYISYSSEKSARERWLLRERLHREHIDLKIVVGSIEDDMRKAVEQRAYHHQGGNRTHQHMPADRHSSRGVLSHYTSSSPPTPFPDELTAADSNTSGRSENETKLILFFKGLGAWGLVMLTGYAFDAFNEDTTPTAASLSNSAPFALLLHSTGFSIFLLYFTGQIRWFLLNGFLGLTMVSLLHHSGLPNRWVVISTHSIGYILLAVVCVIMFLVFGGVVLVWTRLIEFLRDIVMRYPQVPLSVPLSVSHSPSLTLCLSLSGQR